MCACFTFFFWAVSHILHALAGNPLTCKELFSVYITAVFGNHICLSACFISIVTINTQHSIPSFVLKLQLLTSPYQVLTNIIVHCFDMHSLFHRQLNAPYLAVNFVRFVFQSSQNALYGTAENDGKRRMTHSHQ